MRPTGPPVFTGSWGGPSPVSSFRIIDGEPPIGQQVVIDPVQAERGGFEVGQDITISLPSGEPEVFTLSGTIDFGEGGTGGAFFILFDLPTAQRVLGLPGQVDLAVVAAADGVSPDELVTAISAVLPDNLEAVTGEVVIGEQKEDFGSFINIFGNVLLGFAIVVLFVSTFIINNTFATLVGQRTRMFGLMRSIGASSKQIMQMVFIEAGSIGLAASGLGLVGGLGVASALKQLFSSAGGEFPEGPLEIRTRTIIVVVIVGMGVTLARQSSASRLTGHSTRSLPHGGKTTRPFTVRIAAGSAVLLPGLILMAIGMFGNPGGTAATLACIGIGGALTFIGVSMLSAMFAVVAGFIGQPVANCAV